MKLGSHLDKGFWAFADRALPSIYAVAQIAVARVLGLSEYGTFIIFQVIFNMLFSFSDSFALQAIVKYGVEPEIDLEALISSTTTLFLGFLLPILLIFNLFPYVIGSLLGNRHLGDLFPLLALYVLASAPRVVFSKVLQMRFRIKEIFFVDLANFGLGGFLLAFGVYQHVIQHSEQVIWRTVVSAVAASLVALWFGRKHVKIRFSYSKEMFARIKEFVRYQGITGLVSVFQQNIDSLAVSSFTGPIGAGAYGAAKSVYRLFDVLRDTITLLIFPAASKYHSRGDKKTLRIILEKAIGFIYLGLIPLDIILILFSAVFYHLVFGPKFDSSIPIFRILVAGSIVLPVQMVFFSTMVGMGRIKDVFKIVSIGLSANTVVTLILLPLIGIEGAAIAFVIGNIIQATMTYRYIAREIGFSPDKILTRAFSDATSFARSKRGNKKARD